MPALLAVAANALATSVLPVPVHKTKVQNAMLMFSQLCCTASGTLPLAVSAGALATNVLPVVVHLLASK